MPSASILSNFLHVSGTTSVKAHFDGEQIVLDEVIELSPNTPLLVTVLSDPLPETAEWHDLSVRELARAYGADEPEYTLADIVRE